MEKKFMIQKVPLETLLDTLDNLWNEGAKYVDVEGIISDKRDTIYFVVRDEYLTELPISSSYIGNYEDLIYIGP